MFWRLIQDNYHDAYTNMAIDEALLQSEVPVLRFYRWRPPAISIGYFQKLEEEINLEECKRRGIAYVRRITGGKAVLHDKELTYSFVISTELMPKGVIESYKLISQAILTALGDLGLRVEMKEKVSRTQKSSLCFNDPSYYEIVVNGKKIVGSAQVRKKERLLQHGSILIDFDIEKMSSLFKISSPAVRIKKRVTSLNQELKREVKFKNVATALKKGFEENFNIKLIPDNLTIKEKKSSQEIAAIKFSTKEWNHLR